MSQTATINAASAAAFAEGVSASDQDQLVSWIRSNCRYRPETEFFLVLLIGSSLADLEAQRDGFTHEVHRAYVVAKRRATQ